MNPKPDGFFIVGLLRALWRSWKAVRKAWGYSSAVHVHNNAWRRFKKGLRWALLAAFRPRFSVEWFDWVERPDLRPFLKVNPFLALKPFRVYLSIRWNKKRRFKVIRDTYDLVLCRGGAMRQALLHPEGIILARLNIAQLGRIEIGMGTDFLFRKEGEFVLYLQSQDFGGWRMALTFGLEKTETTRWICYIGCVQGRGGCEAMRQTTKAMHGLRPRCLMVFVVQEVARTLGAVKIFGTSNAIHVYRRKHLVHLPFRHNIPFDYDAFWLEFGAKLDTEGWFHLPAQLTRRIHDEMKPNKRSMYVKRYEMLDELADQLRISMTMDTVSI